ncbi:hypothetical protein [Andreprevotia sp. IGB-42]|uniref:hypothetical protein n=1 Tax=Andreprevotia sp. IGB-42 TaxID=2497473 RepID=UPI00135A9CD7|nr:hypothetical protein [Andreprevotia sp. IGB-42]
MTEPDVSMNIAAMQQLGGPTGGAVLGTETSRQEKIPVQLPFETLQYRCMTHYHWLGAIMIMHGSCIEYSRLLLGKYALHLV